MMLAKNKRSKAIVKPHHSLFSIILSLIFLVELHWILISLLNFILCLQISQGNSIISYCWFSLACLNAVFFSQSLIHRWWTYLWVPEQRHGEISSSSLTCPFSRQILHRLSPSSPSIPPMLSFLMVSAESSGPMLPILDRNINVL